MPHATLVYLALLGFTIAIFVAKLYAASFKSLVGELYFEGIQCRNRPG